MGRNIIVIVRSYSNAITCFINVAPVPDRRSCTYVLDSIPITAEQTRFGLEHDEYSDVILPFAFFDGKQTISFC